MTEVRAYCEFYGIRDLDLRFEILALVRLLSVEYLRWEKARRKREERARKSKRSRSKSRSRGRRR